MTPAARWAAAADILDQIGAGEPAEKALTTWARKSRFAGSKDRAAIRDHVFDILRCWRSTAALGGGATGRARVLGRLRQIGEDPETVFTGDGYALAALTDAERAAGDTPDGAVAMDLSDWLFDLFNRDVPGELDAMGEALRHRAPVFLRVNTLRADRSAAQNALAAEGIGTVPHALSETALEVTEGARRIAQSEAFRSGLVELQDLSSQAVVDAIPLEPGMSALDYCAGGGGKTLALAARLKGPVVAHDADPKRMSDLPARAARAGADVTLTQKPVGPFDVVLCDVPCSGSGSWRRAPEGKWTLTLERLDRLTEIQKEILAEVTGLVAEGGVLVYATCSVLSRENEDQVEAFLASHPDWTCQRQQRFGFETGGDGFFVAILTRRGM
ncbi:RsmB/NOP family class I SAM-dependent RNA methyltransferase [Marivita geojedonensis]|uniref:SAM-dependent methlyltransferase n=1 Tax=Marivita geojedonensis TaxID=1123756 RepID=A0A1X4NFH5_9RHOB|nr:RsmB/NOP family class I SAM-dependent RNA methyltransferase [Marivita geojedonensis]OSQ45768.1 SAM-dependent methlyltransferase [Marivita geojedonensis]PRY74009.1 16S rRNA (cytosine967-C5)-methyltransferase [Marivita geojedonensis]